MILERLCRSTDNVSDEAGVGEHRDVATVDGIGGSTHTLGREALQVRWTVRPWLATMYQLGFDFQAVPGAFRLKRSAAGA